MPIDDGLDWDGKANADGAAYVEVEALSTPKTGVIKVQIKKDDSAEILAQKTAKEWNDRDPIAGIFARHEPNSGLVHFEHPYSNVQRMGVAFKGTAITDIDIDQRVLFPNGVGVTRREVEVTIQAVWSSAVKTATAAGTQTTEPAPAKTAPTKAAT